MNQDQEHLRLLSIFHYVMAGFACLLPLVSLLYIGMGAMMLSGRWPSTPKSAHGDEIGGYVFIGFGCMFLLIGLTGTILNFLAGRALARRERRTLCLVVAGLNCLHMPLGTLLGVFTFIVLSRPSVQALFNPASAAVPGGPWPAPGPAYPPGGSPFSDQNR